MFYLLTLVVLVPLVTAVPMVPVTQNTTNSASPVLVEVYYEAVCPACRKFITTMLFPTFAKLVEPFKTGIIQVQG